MSVTNTALRRADRLGFAASLMCAVHCALMPILLAVLPATGLALFGQADIDQAFVVFATLLGVWSTTLGTRRHRRFRAWLLLVPGLALIWIGSFTALHDHSIGHAIVLTLGGALLAAAHLTNLRLAHRPD